MELIELSMENRVFKIHRTLVEKIRKLFHVKNDILLDTIDEMLTDEKLYYDFLETEFINVLTNFCEIVDIDMELLDASEYECKQVLQSLKKDDSFQKIIFHLKNLYDKLFKIRHKYGSESNYAYTFSKRLVNDKVNTINFINVALEFWDIENLFYKYRDICAARDDLFETIEYITSSEEATNLRRTFDNLLKCADIPNLLKLVDYINELCQNHWKEYVSDMSKYRAYDDFAFLGHSTFTTKFSRQFKTRFVSSSLYTPEHMDTFQREYGFILAPENIVVAKSDDVFAQNDAEDVSGLLEYSLINVIDAPEKIVKELDERTSNSGFMNVDIYSEIVLDGFKPIGIFCFTDGSKLLNENYWSATKLKEQFPELDIVDIDKTLYKNDIELSQTYHHLLENIAWHLHREHVPIWKVDSYEYFLNKFMELKKGEYMEEDILNIFKRNEYLLTCPIDGDLFKKYNPEEIEVILNYNESINLGKMIFDYFKEENLEKIYQLLSPYKDENLEDYLPGVSEFLNLYSICHLTEADVLALKKEVFNFEKVCQCYRQNLSESIEYLKRLRDTLQNSNRKRLLK